MPRNVVYIAHPLGSETPKDREANRRKASRWVAWAASIGVAPVADWIILTGQWEETPENRALGLDCDLSTIERCHELWLVGGRLSAGMLTEAEHAYVSGVRVRDLRRFGIEPPKNVTLLDVVTRSILWKP